MSSSLNSQVWDARKLGSIRGCSLTSTESAALTKYLGLSQSLRGWTKHSFRSGPEKWGKKPFLERAAVPWGTKSPGEWPHTTKSRSH